MKECKFCLFSCPDFECSDMLECHKGHPVTTETLLYRWPLVRKYDWCGSFQKKDKRNVTIMMSDDAIPEEETAAGALAAIEYESQKLSANPVECFGEIEENSPVCKNCIYRERCRLTTLPIDSDEPGENN